MDVYGSFNAGGRTRLRQLCPDLLEMQATQSGPSMMRRAIKAALRHWSQIYRAC